jgi:type II secretory pathway pseudopilin PulG
MEVLIAVALSSILLAVVMSLGLYTARSVASVTDSVDLNARSRHAVDRMSKKLRQVSVFNSFSPTSISVAYDGQPLSYTYDPALKTLVENENGTVTTLLDDCNDFKFTLYKRNPVTSSFNQFPVTTSTNEAKVIQMNWRCNRILPTKAYGSTEMVTAKVVLRVK